MAEVKVWIDQDLCTGDGLCAEIAPDVFIMRDDGLAYVQEDGKVFHDPGGVEGLAVVPEELVEDVVDAAEECPGECIFMEVGANLQQHYIHSWVGAFNMVRASLLHLLVSPWRWVWMVRSAGGPCLRRAGLLLRFPFWLSTIFFGGRPVGRRRRTGGHTQKPGVCPRFYILL